MQKLDASRRPSLNEFGSCSTVVAWDRTAILVSGCERKPDRAQPSDEESDSLRREQPWLAGLYAAAVSGKTAYGPNAGRRVTRVGDQIDPESREAQAR
ncbi:MAG: hypothetical protein ACREIF_19605 [Chthoniobacterales bacterium]